jgi:hypothetical protein
MKSNDGYGYPIHILKENFNYQWIPCLARFILTLIVQVQSDNISELVHGNFSNTLHYEKFMHKAKFHMVQLNISLHIEPKQNEQNMTFESTWTFQGA